MSKKFISLAICIAMLLTFALPAFADSSGLQDELKTLALSVKSTLDISDDFSNFTSSVNDYGAYKLWVLTWSNKNDFIRVSCNESGKIVSYNCSNTSAYKQSGTFSPQFTKDAFISSKDAAMNFINKVLDDNETIDFNNASSNYSTYLPDRFYFNGIIKINGLDSPFAFNISVNASTSKVINFDRSYFDTGYIPEVPTNKATFDADHAKSLLSTTYSFKLEYLLDYNTPGKIARLYYTPFCENAYYVDAITGELINKDELYPDNHSTSFNDVAVDLNAGARLEKSVELTPVELENIAKLNGILEKDELDRLLKSKPELGLDNYTLTNLYFSTNKDNDDVSCKLTYTCHNDLESLGLTNDYLSEINYDLITTKSIQLNAKTLQIEQLYTYYPYVNNTVTLSPELNTAENHVNFLNEYYRELFDETKLYNSDSSRFSKSFIYSQHVNNYFFFGNSLNVSVNSRTGFVDNFSKTWSYDVEFEDSENIINLNTVKELFFDSCSTKLSYIAIPTEATKDIAHDTIQYPYLNKLCLAYTLQNPSNVHRIHAKTGELILASSNTQKTFKYSDIDNLPEKDRVLLLSEHGIGFEHNRFDAYKDLTQLDALVLLVNSTGYSFDVSNLSLNDFKALYSTAYNYNFITRDEKDPLSKVSRAEFVKMLVSASIYKNVASLKDIFKCDFNDCDTILDKHLSYVCVARSLGIIVGDSDFNFKPNDIATRLDACNILYNFMKNN